MIVGDFNSIRGDGKIIGGVNFGLEQLWKISIIALINVVWWS